MPNDLMPPGYIEHLISSPMYQFGHLLETNDQAKMGNQSNLYPMYIQPDMSQQSVTLPDVNSPLQKEDNNGLSKYYKNPYSSLEELKHSNLISARQQFQEQRSETSKMTLKLMMPQNLASSEYSNNAGHRQLGCADYPAIDSFNLGDIDHTNMLSADHFYKKCHLEKLQALQEEAKHIAKESAEQSNLLKKSLYGQRSDKEDHTSGTDYNAIDYNLFEPLAKEIQRANNDRKELRKSFADKNSVSHPAENPARHEPLPFSYILDIDLSKAVKEALDFGKTNGMENIKDLMDAIVESLKTSQAEKQLNNVLSMLLSKAIKEYMCREIVVKTINQLNDEMEITKCLVKLLKAQQVECVRVAGTKMCYHEKFSQVMALIYNNSLEWHDSNASIQYEILGIVEKWIVFDHKISRHEILQHNQRFWSRIQSEIRKKVLNEGISRSIREKLLDIMMMMFMLNVDNRDIHTQTSQGTLTESDWIEEICNEMYSENRLESIHFGISEEYLSEHTEPIVHLCTQSVAETKTSASKCSSAASCDLFSSILRVNTPIKLSDISKLFENTIMPPKESLGQKSSDAAGNENRDVEDSLLESNLEPLLLNGLTENSGVSVNTVTENKSALGKSVVNWFENKPPAKDSSEATIDVKQIETKKKQHCIFMEASENDLKLKYSLPKSDNGMKKLSKDKNEVKKSSKMEDNTKVGENIYKSCDKIYGPDVIIEGELEEKLDNENNMVTICSESKTFDTEFDASVQREFVVAQHVDKESVAGKQFEDNFGLESDEDHGSVENFDEGHLNKKYMLDVATAVSEKVDAEMKAHFNYDKNFPKLGFRKHDMMPSNQKLKLDANDKMDADLKYGKKFKKTNLADK